MPELSDPAFVKKVKAYYARTAAWTEREALIAVEMMELAPGVVGVADNWGEFDALFDLAKWRFTEPELWGDKNVTNTDHMNVLPGGPNHPSCWASLSDYAKRHLTCDSPDWHEEPISILVPTP